MLNVCSTFLCGTEFVKSQHKRYQEAIIEFNLSVLLNCVFVLTLNKFCNMNVNLDLLSGT